MGLDTSHNCWHGPYSQFDHWRQNIANAIGIDLNQMVGFMGTIRWENLVYDPLFILLDHSDCDGEIVAADCAPLADRLEEIIPFLENEYDQKRAQQFAIGLRKAAELNENVEFR